MLSMRVQAAIARYTNLAAGLDKDLMHPSDDMAAELLDAQIFLAIAGRSPVPKLPIMRRFQDMNPL